VIVLQIGLALATAALTGVPQHTSAHGRDVDTLPIRIGLLLPADVDPLAQATRRAVRLRVDAANADGGVRGRPVEIIVREIDGPWGAGTGEIVRIVFEDEVVGVIGGLGGRDAHLIEQVVAKGRVVMISPWASDATLSAAFVPWFFRMVPSDRQQAAALWQELLQRECVTVAVIIGDSYDHRVAADAFTREGTARGHAPTRIEAVSPRHVMTAAHLPSDVDAVVVFASPSETKTLAHTLRDAGFDGVFATGLRNAIAPGELGMQLLAPGYVATDSGADLDRRYRARFGDMPTVAAYAYDAVTILLNAVEQAGRDRAAVRNALANASSIGTTGEIRFDRHGNRDRAVEVVGGR